MDPNSNSNTRLDPGLQPQKDSNDGNSLETLFNGMQAYANYNGTPDDPQYDYLFDSSIFPQPETDPLHAQQPPNSNPIWHQNGLEQVDGTNTNNFGDVPSNYPPSHYAQTFFDHRPPPQSSYDQQAMSRPSPSPVSFPPYAFRPGMNFGSRDTSLTPLPSFNGQQNLPEQRSPAVSTTNLSGRSAPTPSFIYPSRATQHPTLQVLCQCHLI